jgi:hypothetical protein
MAQSIFKMNRTTGKIESVENSINKQAKTESLTELLKQTRDKLARAINYYNQMLIDYEETVPKSEFDVLASKYKKTQMDYNRLNAKLIKLKDDLAELKLLNSNVNVQCDDLNQQVEVMRNSSTPRPDWSRCARFVDGGFDRWKTISKGLSSDALLDVLLGELHGQLTETSKDPFGFDDQVTRMVKNRYLNRRELTLALNEIWKAKISHDLANKQRGILERDRMDEFCLAYFNKKFNCKYLAFEWFYNIRSACLRFPDHPAVAYMTGVLDGRLDEEIYHYFYSQIGRLFQALKSAAIDEKNATLHISSKRNSIMTSKSVSISNYTTKSKPKKKPTEKSPNDIITKEAFRVILAQVFPVKSQVHVDELVRAAEIDISEKLLIHKNTNHIEFELLFMETDDGSFGTFLNTLKDQMDCEKSKLIDAIVDKLKGVDIVCLDNFVSAVMDIACEMSEAKIEAFSKWIFQSTNMLDFAEFVVRMKNAAIYR